MNQHKVLLLFIFIIVVYTTNLYTYLLIIIKALTLKPLVTAFRRMGSSNCKIELLVLSLFLVSISLSCKDNSVTPVPAAKVLLEIEDVSCTEIWIKFKLENIHLPIDAKVYHSDSVICEINKINTSDSVLVIDTFRPNQTYNIRFILSSYDKQYTSNSIEVTTMDTTSHNFFWQSWSFGDIGSSTIYDAAILNENDIWCVGEIMMADTVSGVHITYNAVHWDGVKWEMKRILYDGHIWPIQTIYAFNSNDIWFSVFVRYDGINFTELPIPDILMGVLVNRIWGENSKDIYAAGNDGNILRYLNGKWTKIETGTELHFRDIYGSRGPGKEDYEILAVCTRGYPLDKKLYLINGNTASEISTIPIQWELISSWFISGRHYYVAGNGIYEKNLLSEEKWKNNPLDITHYGTGRIRGDALNNVYAVGAFGELIHFNGINWKSHISEVGLYSGAFLAIAVKNKIVIAGGFEGPFAKIVMGRRQ